MPETFTARVAAPLTVSFDPDARIAACPRTYMTKGMFFSKFVALLGADWAEVEPTLESPAKGGRYLPFRDYPVRDYMRCMAATARKRYPQFGLAEGTRHVSRRNIQEFAGSMMGGVVMSLVGSIESALARLPGAYRQVQNSGHVTAVPSGTGMRLEYRDYHGWLDCGELGVIEGVVLHYKRTPEITATLESPSHGVYEVRWT